jgi:uncharacterized RDD family membrane protein YckC
MTHTTSKHIEAGTRFGAMILDHFFMTMIMMIFFIPGMISNFITVFNTTHKQTAFNPFGGNWIYLGLLGFAVYFCKDSINGRSIAKRILKLQLVNNATGEVASPIRCFVRNLFCIIWPIELIVVLINPSRRIGDRVAGTRLVQYIPENEQPKFGLGKMLIPVAMAYGAMLLLMIPLNGITLGSRPVNFVKASYNKQSSNELEKLLVDSVGQLATSDIRVYDTVRNQNIKYISVIVNLKENYLADEEQSSQLQASVNRFIFSKHPEKTFFGNVKYVFKSPGQMQAISVYIGARPKSIETE